MQFPHVHFLHCINQWCLTACTVQLQQISTVFICRQQLPLWWNQIRKLFRLAPQKGNDVNGWMMWFSAERSLLEETECFCICMAHTMNSAPHISEVEHSTTQLAALTMVPNKTGCIFTQEKQNACTCARCTLQTLPLTLLKLNIWLLNSLPGTAVLNETGCTFAWIDSSAACRLLAGHCALCEPRSHAPFDLVDCESHAMWMTSATARRWW